MSNSDSFIDEVSDELRRDRLFHALRRYGWIAVLVVILLVGGAAIWEYRRSQERAEAQAFGDRILAALDADDAQTRRSALREIDAEGTRAALLAMLAADQLEDAEARQTTREALDSVANAADLPQIYRELAVLKSAMIAQAETPPEEIVARLEPLTIPGAPYRLLALEQTALAQVRAGDAEAAQETLRIVLDDDRTTPDLRQRVRQLIVALGGTLDAA